jgi:hypothetical protein
MDRSYRSTAETPSGAMRFPPMVPPLEEALIPRGTKSSNPASSSGESTDCGLGGRVHADLAWAKLRMLVEGARLASTSLWP